MAWSGVAVVQGHGVQILCKSSQKSQCESAVVVVVCSVTARCHLLWWWCVEAAEAAGRDTDFLQTADRPLSSILPHQPVTGPWSHNNNTGADILQCTGAVQCRVYCRYCAVQDILQQAEAQRTANCDGCRELHSFTGYCRSRI